MSRHRSPSSSCPGSSSRRSEGERGAEGFPRSLVVPLRTGFSFCCCRDEGPFSLNLRHTPRRRPSSHHPALRAPPPSLVTPALDQGGRSAGWTAGALLRKRPRSGDASGPRSSRLAAGCLLRRPRRVPTPAALGLEGRHHHGRQAQRVIYRGLAAALRESLAIRVIHRGLAPASQVSLAIRVIRRGLAPASRESLAPASGRGAHQPPPPLHGERGPATLFPRGG